MEYALGFAIALIIALTGVGAGTVTAPMLILFLHVPIALSVGTALVYSAMVKLIVVPFQAWRRQISYRVLGLMLAGGLPGVVGGSLAMRAFGLRGDQALLYAVLGFVVIASSVLYLARHWRPADDSARPAKDRSRWLPALMLPVGAEVGFSSSGAGALGTVALLGLTPLSAVRVVGTDLAFGLCVSLVGGGVHFLSGNYDGALLSKLLVGGVLGAIAGSHLAPRIPNRGLRLALAVWLLAIGVQLCFQAVRAEEVKAARPPVQSRVVAAASGWITKLSPR